jgi:hypothetical protein
LDRRQRIGRLHRLRKAVGSVARRSQAVSASSTSILTDAASPSDCEIPKFTPERDVRFKVTGICLSETNWAGVVSAELRGESLAFAAGSSKEPVCLTETKQVQSGENP